MEAGAGADTVRVGVISDTHGLLRPQALAALAGSDVIVHAGDVGGPEILARLAEVAPVRAVRGNMDRGEWARDLPWTDVVEGGGMHVYVRHVLEDLDLDPVAAGFSAVITGHTHRAALQRRDGVLYLNPGSAGPRRLGLPATLARLRLEAGRVHADLVVLETGP